MRIRTATSADYDALTDLHWRSSIVNERDREWMLANRDIAVFEGRGLDEGHVRVAEIAGRIVGFVTALPEADLLELDDLFVDPDWMRRGIATVLIDDVRRRAREMGITRVEVTANDHAMAFYESAGFVRIGTDETGFRPAPRMRVDL